MADAITPPPAPTPAPTSTDSDLAPGASIVINGQLVTHALDGSWEVAPAQSTPTRLVDTIKDAGAAVAGAVKDVVAPPAAAGTLSAPDPGALIDAAATKYGVDPALAHAIALHGEGFGKYTPQGAVSPKGARGVMQLMDSTAQGLGVDPNDMAQNIDGGVRYIKQLSDQFNGDPELVAAAYNAGPANAAKYGKNWASYPVPDETTPYVQRVTAAYGNPQQPSQLSDDVKAAAFGDGGAGGSQLSDAAKAAAFGDHPAAAAPADPGLGEQLKAGAVETLTSLPEAVNGFGLGGLGKGIDRVVLARDPRVIAQAAAMGLTPEELIDKAQNQFSLSHLANSALTGLGLNPENVPATTPTSRIERAVGGGLATSLIPGADAKGLLGIGGSIIKNALTGGALSGGTQAVSELTPTPVRPAVSALAGVGAALAGHGVKDTARATGSALEPFAAAVSKDAAERQAGKVLAKSASDVGAARNALTGTNQELVPGSKPTTFQLTGDLGLGSLERGAASKSPELFKTRSAEQNAARRGVLTGVQSGGDPVALSKAVTERFDAIDKASQDAINDATERAQAKSAAMGGQKTAQTQGAELRATIADAEAAARAHEGALWKAIDPEGNLTGNVKETVKAADEIAKEIPTTAKPMHGEEAAIFDAARSMKPITPVSDLIALRSRISTAMREELIASGRSPTYARLSQLRGAVQRNLSDTIRDKVESDAKSVAAGKLPQAMSASERLQAALEEARNAGQSVAFGGSQNGIRPSSRGRANGDAGAAGTAVPAGGEPGTTAGNSALSGTPTFDEAAAGRLAAATEATKARARTFGLQPVSAVTAKNGAADLFRLPDGSVPGKFFHSGPAGFEHMQAAIKAGGADAIPVLEDYAAADLRKSAGNPDGTIDPAKFNRWKTANADALRALPPETAARFADAASAAQAVADATVARAEALKSFRGTALGKVMGLTDPDAVSRTMGTILRGQNATAEIRDLVKATKGNSDATTGLRQAIADHIADSLVSNTESGASGVEGLKSDQFQSFMKRNQPALAQVFSPKEMDSLNAIAADLQRANRSVNAVKLPGGSNTFQDISSGKKLLESGKHVGVDLLSALIGGSFGAHLGIPHGEIVGGAMGEAAQQLRSAGVNRVNDLITQALLNPDVAQRLLAKAPDTEAGKAAAMRGLITSIARSAAIPVLTSKPATQATSPNALKGVQGVPLSKSRYALEGVH